jgi:formate dehydrogenase
MTESMVKLCDAVAINAPLHPETENMFNEKLLSKRMRGAYLAMPRQRLARRGRGARRLPATRYSR